MKKKILIVYDFLSEIGGLERVLFFCAETLRKEYDVELVFSYVDEQKKHEIMKTLDLPQDIKITTLFPGKSESFSLLKAFLLPSRLQKIEADLIISNSFMSSVMANRYWKKKKVPYIIVMQHPPNFLYSPIALRNWVNKPSRFFAACLQLVKPFVKVRDRYAVRGAYSVLTNSTYTKNRSDKIYGIDSKVFYPPVNKVFKAMSKERAKKILEVQGIKAPFILSHGRIIPDKMPEYALQVGKILESRGEPITVILSGNVNQEMKDKLERQISKDKIKNVRLLGRVSQETLLALYTLAEVFICTAPKEDFGLTPVEALACGTPVVAWNDSTGPGEIVLDGKNGLLAKPYDAQDMARKVEILLNKKFKSKKIKEIVNSAGRFSEEKIGHELIKVVKEVFGK